MNVGLARASSSTAVCESCVSLMSCFAGVSLLLCEKRQDVLVINCKRHAILVAAMVSELVSKCKTSSSQIIALSAAANAVDVNPARLMQEHARQSLGVAVVFTCAIPSLLVPVAAFHEIPFPVWVARRVMHQCFTKRAGMQANKGEEHTIPAYTMQPKRSDTRHALMLSVDGDAFQVQPSNDLFQWMWYMFMHVPGQALLCWVWAPE